MLSQSYRSFCKKGAVWGITLGLTMSHPDSLNPAQRDAVLHEDGPLLILAGAGSGKTRVITYRLTELLRRGVPAQRLLVVTFTNKAAAELRHRVEQLLLADRLPGAPYPELPRWIGTFHSIGARLLRALASYAKLPQSFVILDEDDLAAGRSILEFIQASIKQCDAVVSVVSAKSLQSGWVGQESVASMYAIWMADKKFIPVRLDDVVFDSKFQIAALKSISAKIMELDKDIQEIRSLGSDARDLEDDRKRLFDLQKEFSTILLKLKTVSMTMIQGDAFEGGMNRVVLAINEL